MVNKPIGWHMCADCGRKKYPKARTNKMMGITVCTGTCPECGQKNKTLIPVDDWLYASGDDSKWD